MCAIVICPDAVNPARPPPRRAFLPPCRAVVLRFWPPQSRPRARDSVRRNSPEFFPARSAAGVKETDPALGGLPCRLWMEIDRRLFSGSYRWHAGELRSRRRSRQFAALSVVLAW